MPLPEKFRSAVEQASEQAVIPDFVWLSYALCVVEQDSCGWQGWIIESAWKLGEKDRDNPINADDNQRCPMCGKPLFRTEVEREYRLNEKAGPKINFEYDVAPVEFTDDTNRKKQDD